MEYYDVKSGLSSAYKIYKSQNKYTYQQVQDMLARNEAYQLNKQGSKTAYFPIVGTGKGSYQADLMFPEAYRGYTCILCIINVITRVAYCYAQKSKSETSDNLEKWLKSVEQPVNFIQTDSGSEFVNKKVNKLFADANIEFHNVDPADHTGQGKIERFNQSLRRLITIYESAYKTSDWVSVLDDLVYNYNHRYDSAIGCSPNEADEDTVFDQELAKYNAAQKQFEQFAIGDKVRVLKNKDTFDKGRKEWSLTVYRIDDIRGHLLHVLNVGWKKHYELQRITAVHTKLFDNNEAVDKISIKKDKKIKRDLRKEGVDAANIVEKRVRETKYDKNLVGRRIDRGNGDTGTINKYDSDGDFKWFVKYDKAAKMKSEWMDKEEVKQFLV